MPIPKIFGSKSPPADVAPSQSSEKSNAVQALKPPMNLLKPLERVPGKLLDLSPSAELQDKLVDEIEPHYEMAKAIDVVDEASSKKKLAALNLALEKFDQAALELSNKAAGPEARRTRVRLTQHSANLKAKICEDLYKLLHVKAFGLYKNPCEWTDAPLPEPQMEWKMANVVDFVALARSEHMRGELALCRGTAYRVDDDRWTTVPRLTPELKGQIVKLLENQMTPAEEQRVEKKKPFAGTGYDSNLMLAFDACAREAVEHRVVAREMNPHVTPNAIDLIKGYLN